MEKKAIAKTVRIAPRKVRLVVDLVRGKNYKEAIAILLFTPRGASPVVSKVVESAFSNLVEAHVQEAVKANAKLNPEVLREEKRSELAEKVFIKEVYVGEGVRLKRMLPRAKGSADVIQKRTSHITVVVAERK